MATTPAAPPTAKTIRLIHAALIAGVIMFALVAHFVLRQTMANSGDIPADVLRLLLGVSIAACALGLVLRRRVPRRSPDESADLFWRTAATPALITWTTLEGAGLIAVFVYANTSSPTAIGVAAVAIVLSLIHNPASLERR